MKRILFIPKSLGFGYAMAVQYFSDALKVLGYSVVVGVPTPNMRNVDLIIDSEFPGNTHEEAIREWQKYAPVYLNTFFESWPLPSNFLYALQYYDGIIAHSSYEKELFRLSGVSEEDLQRVHILPLPVFYDESKLTKENYRAELEIPENTYVIGAIGSPTIRKGFVEDFIAYLNAFNRIDPSKVMLLYRPTPYPQFVESGRQIFSIIKALKAQSRTKLQIKVISDPELNVIKFYNTLNALISLHHAEGFGLPLAECSLLDKQLIATAYSGNMDFMSESSAYLVPAYMSYNTDPYPIYNPTMLWADPILPAAADQLRTAYNDFIAGKPKSNREFYMSFYQDALDKTRKFVDSNETRMKQEKTIGVKDKLIEL